MISKNNITDKNILKEQKQFILALKENTEILKTYKTNDMEDSKSIIDLIKFQIKQMDLLLNNKFFEINIKTDAFNKDREIDFFKNAFTNLKTIINGNIFKEEDDVALINYLFNIVPMINYCVGYLNQLSQGDESSTTAFKTKITKGLERIQNFQKTPTKDKILNLIPFFCNTNKSFKKYNNTRLKENLDYLILLSNYDKNLEQTIEEELPDKLENTLDPNDLD